MMFSQIIWTANDQSCHSAARILHLFCSATLSVWLSSCGSLSGWCTSAVFLLKQEWMQGCVAPSMCWTISLDSPETSSNSLFQNSAAWSFFATGWKETFYFCSGVFNNRGGQEKMVVNPYSLFQGLHRQPKIRGDFSGSRNCRRNNMLRWQFLFKTICI